MLLARYGATSKMLTCKICGYQHATMISPSHLKSHSITGAEYKQKYPGSVLRIQSEESKLKMATTKKGKAAWNKGLKTGPNSKLSESVKGKPRLNNRGKTRTLEQRKNISEAVKKAMIGKMTNDVRKKLSDAIAIKKENGTYVPPMLGKKVTEDTKKRITDSLKRTNAVKSQKILIEFEKVANAQGINVTSIEDGYWFNFNCTKCDFSFTFSRQIFRNSTKGGQNICPKCHPRDVIRSKSEDEVAEYIASIYENDIELNDRQTLGGKEIDILLPALQIGFEFTGLYWHSEKQNAEKNHLLWKMQHAVKKGITLITIFEDEWEYKKDIVKSRIAGLLNLHAEKIHARKCSIAKIDAKTKNEFLEKNHIQGKDVSQINLGLMMGSELVSVMTFKKTNMVKGGDGSSWEISRFCSRLNARVVGGAGKLIKYFQEVFNTEKKPLISYADRRWSTGKLYETLGFRFAGTTSPSYWYMTDYKVRKHRSAFMKHKLLENVDDKNMTEWELAQKKGLDRIWDCGTTKWILQGS